MWTSVAVLNNWGDCLVHDSFLGLFGQWGLTGLWLSSQPCSEQRNSLRSYLWKVLRILERSLLETRYIFFTSVWSNSFPRAQAHLGLLTESTLLRVYFVIWLVGVLVHFYLCIYLWVNSLLKWCFRQDGQPREHWDLCDLCGLSHRILTQVL